MKKKTVLWQILIVLGFVRLGESLSCYKCGQLSANGISVLQECDRFNPNTPNQLQRCEDDEVCLLYKRVYKPSAESIRQCYPKSRLNGGGGRKRARGGRNFFQLRDPRNYVGDDECVLQPPGRAAIKFCFCTTDLCNDISSDRASFTTFSPPLPPPPRAKVVPAKVESTPGDFFREEAEKIFGPVTTKPSLAVLRKNSMSALDRAILKKPSRNSFTPSRNSFTPSRRTTTTRRTTKTTSRSLHRTFSPTRSNQFDFRQSSKNKQTSFTPGRKVLVPKTTFSKKTSFNSKQNSNDIDVKLLEVFTNLGVNSDGFEFNNFSPANPTTSSPSFTERPTLNNFGLKLTRTPPKTTKKTIRFNSRTRVTNRSKFRPTTSRPFRTTPRTVFRPAPTLTFDTTTRRTTRKPPRIIRPSQKITSRPRFSNSKERTTEDFSLISQFVGVSTPSTSFRGFNDISSRRKQNTFSLSTTTKPRSKDPRIIRPNRPKVLECFSCGSLFSKNSPKCNKFDSSNKDQRTKCAPGEACLWYSWQKSPGEFSTIRECFPTDVLLGSIEDPLVVDESVCVPQRLTDGTTACLCATNYCNGNNLKLNSKNYRVKPKQNKNSAVIRNRNKSTAPKKNAVSTRGRRVKCYSCGGLFSDKGNDCDSFDSFSPSQRLTCKQGEACLWYTWEKAPNEVAITRECFSSDIVLGSVDSPVRPSSRCEPQNIADDPRGYNYACICTSDYCNGNIDKSLFKQKPKSSFTRKPKTESPRKKIRNRVTPKSKTSITKQSKFNFLQDFNKELNRRVQLSKFKDPKPKKRGPLCYNCGSLFSNEISECKKFDPSDPLQRTRCDPGEVCLFYNWQKTKNEFSVIRECFHTDVLLGPINNPLRVGKRCIARNITEDGGSLVKACICDGSDFCNGFVQEEREEILPQAVALQELNRGGPFSLPLIQDSSKFPNEQSRTSSVTKTIPEIESFNRNNKNENKIKPENNDGILCYACGSLFDESSRSKNCKKFDKSSSRQRTRCPRGDVCLWYSWNKTETEVSLIRECFSPTILLGPIENPLVPSRECFPRKLEDNSLACLCTGPLCNDPSGQSIRNANRPLVIEEPQIFASSSPQLSQHNNEDRFISAVEQDYADEIGFELELLDQHFESKKVKQPTVRSVGTPSDLFPTTGQEKSNSVVKKTSLDAFENYPKFKKKQELGISTSKGNATITTAPPEKCPPKFKYVKGTSNCYFFSETELSWIEAKKACQDIGSTLVSFESNDEIAQLEDRVKTDRSSGTAFSMTWWTSANDIEVEGTWEWLSGHAFQLLLNSFYRSSDSNSSKRNCVSWTATLTRPDQTVHSKFDSTACCNSYRFICEKQINSQ